MQDIYIDKVKFKNFRHYGDTYMEMDFPPCFTVFVGKIGTGKSSICKATTFALYGNSGAGETANDLINEKTMKNMEVFLNFRIVNAGVTDNYEIRSYCKHSKYSDKLFLFKNDVDISQRTKTDTYDLITNLIYPQNVFLNSVYFMQQVKDFFTALTNSEQKQIFDAIFSLKEYSDYSINCDRVISGLSSSISVFDKDIAILENTISQKISSYTLLTQNIEEQKRKNLERISELKKRKESIEDNIQILELERENLSPKESVILQDLLDERSKLAAQINLFEDEKKSKVNSVEEDKIRDLRSLLKDHNSNLLSAKEQCRVKYDSLSVTINQRLVELHESMRQLIDKYQTDALERQITENQKVTQAKITKILQYVSEGDTLFSTDNLYQEKKKEISDYQQRIEEIRKLAEPISSSASVTANDISKIEKDIAIDEASFAKETAICTKCKQPLGIKQKEELAKEIDEKKKILIDLKEKLASLSERFTPLKEEAAQLKNTIQGRESYYDSKIQDLISKKAEYTRELYAKKSSIESEELKYRKEINDKISALKKELQEKMKPLNEEDSSLLSQSQALEAKLKEELYYIDKNLKIEYTQKEDEIQKKWQQVLVENMNFYILKVEKLNGEVEVLTTRIDSLKYVENRIKEINDKIMLLKNSIQQLIIQIAELENIKIDDSKLSDIQNEIQLNQKKLEEIRIEIQKQRSDNEVLLFWKEAFSDSGIKNMLIDYALPFMNTSVRQVLNNLCPNMFTVSFDTLKKTKAGDFREKFSVNILHNLKKTSSHKKLSGGEKRLVDLACMRALKLLSEQLYEKRIHNNFLDESLDATDADTSTLYCQYLKTISRDENVTLITHASADYMEADRIFKF